MRRGWNGHSRARASLAGSRALCAAVLTAVLALGLAAPATAFAQDARAAEDAAARYKLHMANGVKLYQDKNYQAAIAEFEAAYAAQPKPSPLTNVALCHKAQFRYPKAIATLERALAAHGEGMSAADKKQVTDAIAEMKGLLGFVEVTVVPAEATIAVDGEALPAGAARQPIPLGPGEHTLAAEAPGYARAEQKVTVTSGNEAAVAFRLTPDKGFLKVKTAHPSTVIEVDGKRMGTGAWGGLLAPGQHVLVIYPPASPPQSTSVIVTAGLSQEIGPGAGLPGGWGGGAAPPGKPKEPDKPPLRGFYALAAANVFVLPQSPTSFKQGDATGGSGGLRAGYRPATPIAFELMFQFSNITSDGTVTNTVGDVNSESDVQASYSLSTTLVGANFRLMSSGRKVRFVTTLGGGLAYDDLSWEDCGPAGVLVCGSDATGAEGFVQNEIGLELDFGGVLLGAVAQQVVSSSGNVKLFSSDPLVFLGLGLRIGYATW